MKVTNRFAVEAHEERLKALEKQYADHLKLLEASAPTPVEIEKHEQDDNAPLELGGVVVMSGDYILRDGDSVIVIAAADVGKGLAWEPVK